MIEMVHELRKLPQHQEVVTMVMEAVTGEFHDYKNQKYVCGKMTAAQFLFDISEKYSDCQDALKIREEIITGAYDETPDQEDQKMLDELLKEIFNGEKTDEA
jgi:hypothetical protein